MKLTRVLRDLFSGQQERAPVKATNRRARRRRSAIEPLEGRHLLAAAIWHNVLQPLNVSDQTDGQVSPIDALLIINELNSRQYSDQRTSALQTSVPDGERYPFLDTTCDAFATPLDALLVINAINTQRFEPGWSFNSSNGTSGASSHLASASCSPKLIEGTSLSTELRQQLVVPNSSSAIRVSFEAPVFDQQSQNSILDAFELLVLDEQGIPLVLPFARQHEAAFNWSEGNDAMLGAGSQLELAPSGAVSTATFNLNGLAAGRQISVVVRLVNNDADVSSSVVIRRLEIIDSQVPAPTGSSSSIGPQSATNGIDPSILVDVSTIALPVYGRTTLDQANRLLTTELRIENKSTQAYAGPLVVTIDNISDPSINVLQPDGFLAGGRPYFVLPNDSDGWIAAGDQTGKREIQFSNPNGQQFSYSVKVLAQLNSPPREFSNSPVTEIEASKSYRTRLSTVDPDGQTLVYQLMVSPVGMTIDSSSGDIEWETDLADVGNHSVVVRASDPFGLSVQKSFTITVSTDIPNRPPIFTSLPPSDAIVASQFEVQTLPAGNQPIAVVAGDFGNGLRYVTGNAGDANLTLVNQSGSEAISLGEPRPGDMVFRDSHSIDVGLPPFFNLGYARNGIKGFAQADLNQDGFLDFVTSNFVYDRTLTGEVRTHNIAIVLGNGDATFQSPRLLSLPVPNTDQDHVSSPVVADFDGDGHLDVIATYYYEYNIQFAEQQSKLLFFKGNGDGTFQDADATLYNNSNIKFTRIQAIDINRDQRMDLVVTLQSQTQVGVVLGNGDGSFGEYQEFINTPGAGYYYGMSFGDLDGVNGPDLVAPDWQRQEMLVYLNNGAGMLTQSAAIRMLQPWYPYGGPIGTERPTNAFVGDFDGDGIQDIVGVATSSGKGGGGLSFYKGSGDGIHFEFSSAASSLAYRPFNVAGDVEPVDFNGDGQLDIVLGAGSGSYGISVALGNGDGTFSATVYQNSVADRHAGRGRNLADLGIAIGDYNSDGILDVAAAGSTQDASSGTSFAGVSILYADRHGMLAGPIGVTESTQYQQIVNLLGDINNDGDLDLIIGDGARFMSRIGNGDGTFQAAQVATPSFYANDPHDAFLADLDHDGNLDLVWSRIQLYQGANQGMMAALGNGDGTFRLTFNEPAPNFYGAGQIIKNDFNQDGYIDFAAAGGGAFANGAFVDVWLYNPSIPGTFTRGSLNYLPFEASTRSLVSADFDRDGLADFILFLPLSNEPRKLLFYKGRGNGTFDSPIATPVFTRNSDIADGNGNWAPAWTAVGDLNEDGILDLVLTSSYSRSAIFLGNGDGSFQTPIEYATGTFFASDRQIYLEDLNADGHLDLLSINDNESRNHLVVRLGDGHGRFSEEQVYASGGRLAYLAMGDVNNDGVVDIVASSNGNLNSSIVYFGNLPSLTDLTSADVNGDGRIDLLAVNEVNDRLKLLLGRGDQTFDRQLDIIVDRGPIAVVAADLDGDRDIDIVSANHAGRSLSVLTQTSDHKFERADIEVGTMLTAMAHGALDNDSRPDVVVASAEADAIFVLRNSVNGLQSPQAMALGDTPGALVIGDFNGDGLGDVCVALPESRRIMLLPNNGAGGFEAPIYVQLDAAIGDLSLADFNLDGKLDIAVGLPEDGRVAILSARGNGRFAKPQWITVGKSPTDLETRDVNGDGRVDLMVANRDDNTISAIINRYDPNLVVRYDVTTFDADGDPLQLELVDAPGGVILDEVNGQLLWAPTADQVGRNQITLSVSDGRGGIATQSFAIEVQPAIQNAPPVIFSDAPPLIEATKVYQYNPAVLDPDGDAVRYRLISGPEGAEIDAITGQVTWDARGNGLLLNQSGNDTGYIRTPMSDSLMAMKSLTAEGLFRIDRNEINQGFFRKFTWAPYPFAISSFGLRFYFGTLRASIGGFDASGNLGESSIGKAWTPNPGQWYHLAMTFDDPTGVLSVYVDGQLFDSAPTGRHLAFDGNDLQLGYDQFDPLWGKVDDFRVWNYAKSIDQVRRDYLSNPAADAPGLLIDYRFNDGDAQTILDHSQFANHGRRASNEYRWPELSFGAALVQTQHFVISVEDGKGGVVQQAFDVSVTPPQRHAITGSVYQDDDGDGVRDGGEAALATSVVYVDVNANGVLDGDEPRTTTDDQGNFRIEGMVAGRYRVASEPRAGYAPALHREVDLVFFSDASTSFGLQALAGPSISGRVLIDSDRDGITGEDVQVHSADFTLPSPDLRGLSQTALTTAPNGQQLLGTFSQERVVLQVGSSDLPLPIHQSLTISFDLVLIDGWYGDWRYASTHPTQWALDINGSELVRATFSNTPGYNQSYPLPTGSATSGAMTGAIATRSFGYAADSTYHMSFTIPHDLATAAFTFRAIDAQYNTDRPLWALKNIDVTALESPARQWPVYLDTNGNGLRDTDEPMQFTDSHGDYTFAQLAEGDWQVRIDHDAAWGIDTPISGSYQVNLQGAANSLGNNFVIVPTADAASLPRFISTPLQEATARQTYRFDSVAIDPAQRPLSYALELAPAGMSVDANHGRLIWTPTISQVGAQRVVVKVTNDRGGVALQDFMIDVATANSAPVIVSTPPTKAFASTPFHYEVRAQDAEQSSLMFELMVNPIGAVINTSTGEIDWTPSADQSGLQQFRVRVVDAKNEFAIQNFAVNVLPGAANRPPDFNVLLREKATVNQWFIAQLAASDPDGDLVQFSIDAALTGATVNAQGLLTWKPTIAQLGLQTFTIRASDGRGGETPREFAIEVGTTLTNSNPQIVSSPNAIAIVERLFAYDIQTSDPDHDPAVFQLVNGPSGMSLDGTRGTLRWQPERDQLGRHSITIRSIDPYGGIGEQSFEVIVQAAGGPPAITSIPPTRAVVGNAYLYSVQANDAEDDPLRYQLLTAPVGMVLDEVTGELNWNPAVIQAGVHTVSIEVSDGLGGFATQTFKIEVLAGAPNRAPAITSAPLLSAAVGTTYASTIVAADPEQGALVYALRRGPNGMTVDPGTGVVTWTPQPADVGRVVVAWTATDAGGATAVQSFELDVLANNASPVIVSPAVFQVTARSVYRYNIAATDANLDALSYQLVSGPIGMTVDAFGQVRWTTTINHLGSYPVSIRVSDPRGGTAQQDYTLTVVRDMTPPRVTVIPAQNIVRSNSPETFATFNLTPVYPTNTVRVSAVDDVGVVEVQVIANGRPVTLDAFGNALFRFEDWGFGSITVVATAFDAAGNRATGARAFAFLPFGDDPVVSELPDPTAVITSPAISSAVGGLVDIIGSATSENFTGYTLSYRRGDSGIAKTIATGTAKITAGLLGRWDTTLLENDEYILRLEVFDEIFGTTAFEASVGVSGNVKVGNFRVSFQDLTIPGNVMPITIQRTYDTLRSDRSSDFGFGWRLEYRNVDLRTNLPKTGLEDLGIYTSFKPGTKVYLTLPGGSREGFTFTPELRVLPGFGSNLITATPRFTPDPGVRNELRVKSGTFIVNETGELISGGGQPYNPAAEEFGGGYSLVTADGSVYRIDGDSGLLSSVTDRNQNQLTFTDSGIQGPGSSITFERDAVGRITSITDPAGNKVRYRYSASGDLIAVTDRDNHVTTFEYQSSPKHYLSKIVDPLGRTGIRTQYDANGRLISNAGSGDRETQFSYDMDHQLVQVTNELNQTRVYEYDDRGNIVRSVDPLGATAMTEYDANNLVTKSIDANGNVNIFQYDANGNLTTAIDALGQVTRTQYDAFGNLLTLTDPQGNSTTSSYDARGNLITQTDPDGSTVRYQRDEFGRLVSKVDAAGNSIELSYDSVGNWVRMQADDGTDLQLLRNANGQILSQAEAGGLQWTASYSAGGKILSLNDGSNQRVASYDAAGRTTQVGSRGAIGTFQYDESGNVTSISSNSSTASNGSAKTISRIFDSAGQIKQETDVFGFETEYVYDDAGRLIVTHYPDGDSLTRTYDAVGNLLSITDSLGRLIRYEYDALNRMISESDQAGRQIHYRYDKAGNLSSIVDASGSVTQFEYSAGYKRTAIIYPDGSRETFQYDSVGQLSSTINAAGAKTEYVRDMSGRLTQVIDAMGGITRYQYDAVGRLIQHADPLGNETEYEYDSAGRLTKTTFADGSSEQTIYDLDGIVATINGNGQRIEYSYNSAGQIASTLFPDGARESYEYSSNLALSKVIDSVVGATQVDTEPVTGRILRVTEPDGRYVRYEYDARGNRTLMATAVGAGLPEQRTEYRFDNLDRMIGVTDFNGGQTTYTYDVSSAVKTITYANGMVAEYSYDTNHRMVAVAYSSATGQALAQYVSSRDAVGNRQDLALLDGSRIEFKYDALGRVITEVTKSPAGVIIKSIAYSYDAAGNLLTKLQDQTLTTYVYNSANQLVSGGGVQYQYDRAGNLVRETAANGEITRYEYDARNRLIKLIGPSGSITEYQYAFDGMRTAIINDGVVTKLWVDRLSATGHPEVVRESGAAEVIYTYGRNLLSIDSLSTTSFLLADTLGTVRATADAQGVVTHQFGYSAFGEIDSSSTGLPRIGMAGQQYDVSSGLYYMRARYYDPAVGRFISRDPAAPVAESPLSYQEYLYANGNPLNNIDPTGEYTLTEMMTGIQIRAQQLRERLPRFKRAYEQSIEFVGEVGQVVGGMLAASAVVEVMQGKFFRAIRWFGANPIAIAAGEAKTVRIMVGMFGGVKVDYASGSPELVTGVVSQTSGQRVFPIAFVSKRQVIPNVTVIDVSATILLHPPLPRDLKTASIGGIILHEFSHIVLQTSDYKYSCDGATQGLAAGLNSNWLQPQRGTDNADTYRCFAEDSAIGFGANGPLQGLK